MTTPALRPAAHSPRSLSELPGVLRPSPVAVAAGLPGPSSISSPSGPADPAALASLSVLLSGVTHDSRAVLPGDLYAALPGAHAHGADFAQAAVAAGAVAVLTDPAGAARLAGRGLGVPVLATDDPRRDLAPVAAWVYGRPSDTLTLLGVTGTNGKTTTAFLLEAGLRAAGHTTGLLGTVQTRIAGAAVPAVRTTPESPDLQALLATMVERGVTAAAMEVSSHALAQHRVDALRFAGAAFTNLSQDHLDFHPTMEDYFAAKAALFDSDRSAAAVICVDDEWGRRLAGLRPDAQTCSVAGNQADWWPEDVVAGPAGTVFRALGPDGAKADVSVALPGRFNAANALTALALLSATGVPLEAAAEGISALTGVPGRMERVDGGQPFLALVDYAHTPDAVATLLAAVRPLVTGRVIIVLGCGGDRDRAKRPLMGAAAARLADLSVFTNDNPRSEDPALILDQIVAGARGVPAGAGGGPGRFVVEPDRAAAIALAVAEAGPADAVVVAGKGHESGQNVAGVVTPFDDREVLGAVLRSAAGR
ncbi:UDP-N-acetylmuramoyl-L-alanyl-D-glutamate--2,6-diaminopimelate ligase [Parafrankia colletiae]|uniref:UDP-N-acetylmuramoyl-L-alanyl-D-glutamate--2,6-diaminopimelate ligase n=1 Tax=Parafrankia colletiae TaxID=573497 RepID=A0A1S1RD90_9ACTN|nr:UDP-N-acetylmuramoyl-L-alanyl-D-glutamate--2,6-diaminopimelate ligase [Parafrankia colletiae]MCK9900471.1 UDP-N-acetylmuramoyl-L-alanyl-D-glutamate--2,6-diaminopimelate ligase [Frankia sp. Cpl3]OHV43192.1 UDP-N-acetylmuramoyl-L-alanyl-D-glutamate--2,6-diaminopimelate ligase [Parafrankia colletiae]